MTDLLKIEQSGAILTIGLNRPDKKNAMNTEMFRGLSAAYTRLCDDPELRCGVLYSTLDLFTAGLDLIDMAPVLSGQEGNTVRPMTEENQVEPFNWCGVAGQVGRLRSKPMLTAINGRCFTAGIELALGTDIVVAEQSASFEQSEIRRGLMPLGGGVERLLGRAGWGNAMRWLLTGDRFDAAEAHRIGLVQELVPDGQAFKRAMEIAERIASAAPIGVQGTLQNAFIGDREGPLAAAKAIAPYVFDNISPSKDLQEGITAMFERREPNYTGR